MCAVIPAPSWQGSPLRAPVASLRPVAAFPHRAFTTAIEMSGRFITLRSILAPETHAQPCADWIPPASCRRTTRGRPRLSLHPSTRMAFRRPSAPTSRGLEVFPLHPAPEPWMTVRRSIALRKPRSPRPHGQPSAAEPRAGRFRFSRPSSTEGVSPPFGTHEPGLGDFHHRCNRSRPPQPKAPVIAFRLS